MEIKLDDLKFQEVFTASIIQALDNGKKEELIKGALAYLFFPLPFTNHSIKIKAI